jgi:hypothetical protein
LHASTERDFDMVFATLVQLRVGALAIGSDIPFSPAAPNSLPRWRSATRYLRSSSFENSQRPVA